MFLGGNSVDGDLRHLRRLRRQRDVRGRHDPPERQAGDIILRNADCAEEFDLAGDDGAPGTVVVIGGDGRLHASTARLRPPGGGRRLGGR